ncbi:flagellar biosynthetic protein FliO [Telmatobacter bradus]|uniref:flagellar biosynthetic protein FliO n=1 Tax=Telmatobacter bradus TaxID=474953 RepID=UPI003B43BF10
MKDRMQDRKTGGLAGWLLEKLNRTPQSRSRLEMIDRITLAPRQTLSLIEVEGRRFLVASAADGSPSFYPLDAARSREGHLSGRVSW